MGHKNFKGSVSITNYKGRIRLRWRYQLQRYSLSLSTYNRTNLLQAKKVAFHIEQDISKDQFDFTLKNYSGKIGKTSSLEKTIVQYFEEWTINYKQMDCDKHKNYHTVRNMLKTWGIIRQDNILAKLNCTSFCEKTYNRRLSMLKNFGSWMVKQGFWTNNPLEDVQAKRCKKNTHPKRKPFTEDEIRLILDAFKKDSYCHKKSAIKHSHYYPFVYFIFKTGVRNAEAVGLRVGSIDFQKRHISIKEVLARTLQGSHSSARVRKETKNGKERILPLTSDLLEILKPLTDGRNADDLVFLSPTGLSIDDDNFQFRVFKKVLKALKIEERVLYACRHTFGSRCIDSGITPVMTAFLMGNNPETALRNYTHQLSIPTDLPAI